MSNYVVSPLPASTHFVGLAAAATGASLSAQIKDDDSRRLFWLQHVVPKLTEAFLEEVIRVKRARFIFPGLDVVHSPEDDSHNPFHTAYYQDFPHLCASNRIQARYVPWQFRFVFHPSLRTLLDSPNEYHDALGRDVFAKAGWSFWVTEDGFCMAPSWLDKELSDLAYVHSCWMEMRRPTNNPIIFDSEGIPLLPSGIPYPLLPFDQTLPRDPPPLQRLAAPVL
jgi:hypothetical protein